MKIKVGEHMFEAQFASVLQTSGRPELVITYEDSRPMSDIVRTWHGNEKIIVENVFGDVQEYLGFGDIRRIVRDSDTEVFIGLAEGGARNGG